MIILRKIKAQNKLFSLIKKKERDPLPNKFPIPEEWKGKYIKTKVIVSYGPQYSKDMMIVGDVQKKVIRNLIKDIKNGYYYTDGPNGGDTHYLAKESKPSKFHRMTKSPNNFDRLDYNIYPYELDEKNKQLIIPIVIQSVKYHNIPGKGLYSVTEED